MCRVYDGVGVREAMACCDIDVMTHIECMYAMSRCRACVGCMGLTVLGGRTALHYAAREDRTAAMEMLLGRGADMEAKDNVRYVALRLVEVCASCSQQQDWPETRLGESCMHRLVKT